MFLFSLKFMILYVYLMERRLVSCSLVKARQLTGCVIAQRSNIILGCTSYEKPLYGCLANQPRSLVYFQCKTECVDAQH